MEYSDNIIDIREQFPLLSIDETISIAKELGINHIADPKTKELIVMTTDFLITIKDVDGNRDVARTVKSSEDLMDKRILEKFEIERLYWKKRNVDWGIVTEKEIDCTIAKNISYIHNYYNIYDIDSLRNLEEEQMEDMILEYIRGVLGNKEIIRNSSNQFDEDLFLSKGTGIAIFKHLIMKKIFNVDLSKTLNVNKFREIEVLIPRENKELNIL